MKITWHDQRKYYTGPERHRYRATLYDIDCDNRTIPSSAVEFAQWYATLLMSIPEELRAQAVLELHGNECGECGDNRASFYIYVDRQETDEEYAARRDIELTEAARKKEAAERAERSNYERLKKKYGE